MGPNNRQSTEGDASLADFVSLSTVPKRRVTEILHQTRTGPVLRVVISEFAYKKRIDHVRQ